MEFFDTFIRFFQDGGLFMYPIAAVLALGVAISIERWVFLSASGAANRSIWDKLIPNLHEGNYKAALADANKSTAAVGQILSYGLSRVNHQTNDAIEMAMEESLMETLPHLEKRTHYLATFANIATLLGLLGTIIGLIQAFTAVANANPAEKADLLSASISVAMNTTAFGLMAAIPLLLLHALLTSKTTALTDSLEMAAVKFMNILNESKNK